jgi:hypothetical protein
MVFEEQQKEFQKQREESGIKWGESPWDLLDLIGVAGTTKIGGDIAKKTVKVGKKWIPLKDLAKKATGIFNEKEALDVFLKNMKNLDDVIPPNQLKKVLTSDKFIKSLTAGKMAQYTDELLGAGKFAVKELGEDLGRVTPRIFAETAEQTLLKGADVMKKELFEKAAEKAGIKTVTKLMARFGLSYKNAVKIVQSAKVQNFLKSPLGKLGIAGGAAGLTGLALKGTGVVIGVDILTNWAALDNVMGQQSILIRDLTNSAKFGQISPEKARELIEESESIIDIAESKIEGSIKWDPALILSKKLWKAGIDSTRQAIEVNKMMLDEIQNKENLEKYGTEDISGMSPEEKEKIMKQKEHKERAKEFEEGKKRTFNKVKDLKKQPEFRTIRTEPSETSARRETQPSVGFGLI